MKKIITLFCLLFCVGSTTAQTLKIGTLPAADSIVLYVAAEEGLFKAQGLEVDLVPFKSAMELGAAMRAGQLDGHFGDLMNVLSQNEHGVKQSVILTTTHTHVQQRSFGLAVSPKVAQRIQSLSDLKNTSTAISSSTIIDYLLSRMTQAEKLPADALKMIEVKQIPIRLQMLLSGQCDTALLPEPLISVVQTQGGRVIWDDRQLNEALAVVALKKERLEASTVKGFRLAVAQAAQRIEDEPNKYRAVMVQKRMLPQPVAAQYQMVRFSMFDTADALPPLPSQADIKRVGQWMYEKGILKMIPNYDQVVYQVQ